MSTLGGPCWWRVKPSGPCQGTVILHMHIERGALRGPNSSGFVYQYYFVGWRRFVCVYAPRVQCDELEMICLCICLGLKLNVKRYFMGFIFILYLCIHFFRWCGFVCL